MPSQGKVNKLTQSLNKGLTVRELISRLSEFNPDKKVVFKYPSGDHWRTQLAMPVESLEYGDIEYSGYHSLPKVKDGEIEDLGDEENVQNVVILNF